VSSKNSMGKPEVAVQLGVVLFNLHNPKHNRAALAVLFRALAGMDSGFNELLVPAHSLLVYVLPPMYVSAIGASVFLHTTTSRYPSWFHLFGGSMPVVFTHAFVLRTKL
jgi:hypothetical protein